jgi:hypothetical protein
MKILGLDLGASVSAVSVSAVTVALAAAGCSSSSGGGASPGGGTEGGAAPTIAITGLASGASVPVTTDDEGGTPVKTVPIPFTITNFTLAAPGTCPGGASNASCGHIHVLVDGAACTPSGAPYDNADTTGSPAIAILSTCSMVNGAHTVSLELHNDAHAALVPPVSTSVMITATGG